MSSTRLPASPAVPPQSPAPTPPLENFTLESLDRVRNAQADAEAADWRALEQQIQRGEWR